MKQDRWRSKVMWLSVSMAIISFLAQWKLFEFFGIDQESVKVSVNLFLLVLIEFGIINNPTDKGNL